MATFRKAGKHKAVAEINVVPYIDVMLVLLVIFMITAPMLQQGVEVKLPQASAKPLEKKEDPLIVSIKPDGSLYVNLGNEETSQPIDVVALKDKVSKVLGAKPETPVLVWGDQSVDYGKVVALMTELQQAGAENVGLVTEPPR